MKIRVIDTPEGKIKSDAESGKTYVVPMGKGYINAITNEFMSMVEVSQLEDVEILSKLYYVIE